jgi:hypothetical protein
MAPVSAHRELLSGSTVAGLDGERFLRRGVAGVRHRLSPGWARCPQAAGESPRVSAAKPPD